MSQHVFLRFFDEQGRIRTAPISMEQFSDLLNYANRYEYKHRPRNFTTNPDWEDVADAFRRFGQAAKSAQGTYEGIDPLAQLRRLAGVEPGGHESTQKLIRLAQRRCHPDTGGSHSKWLELTKLRERLKI